MIHTRPTATAARAVKPQQETDMTTPTIDQTALAQREKIPCQVFQHSKQVSVAVAQQIAQLIRDKADAGARAVFGLATGSTPVGVYAELVRMHKEDGLSFRNAVTFNLDEYYPMQPNELQSYHRFMQEHLFDHIDIDPANVHIPDGTLPMEQVYEHCRDYERAIAEVGGIDLQILGIGRTGHIGFNEPGSGRESRTRLITLDRITRLDAADDFFGTDNVPRRAITMGVGTIFDARRVLLIAFGEGKAPIVAEAVEGPVRATVPATYLQEHTGAQALLDDAAAASLTRYASPWLLGPVQWTLPTIRRAVIWLAKQLERPILKLTDEDYNEGGLQDLLADHGPADDINVSVFRTLQKTITGWPGGRPPEKRENDNPATAKSASDATFPKRVMIFSPHPDDDVISMGGTLIRLANQGHEVHVAYQVSGSIAVFDDDAVRFADFAAEFSRLFDQDESQASKIEQHIDQFLKNKQPGQVDSDMVQKLKALIRRGEARAATRACGVPAEHLHFLDMPFYETGVVRKKPLSTADIDLIHELLQKVKPHQIYAAGDLSDPHGTHRVCLSAIIQAMERLHTKKEDWFKSCEVLLYRGAWQEWGVEEIDIAVPLAPRDLMRKRNAIFKHESQKDRALFPGIDAREFWQRAEDRNRETARVYDQLGLAEYEAVEGFVRWDLREDRWDYT